jgi:hypothetical protein
MSADVRALLARVDKAKPKAEDLDALRATLREGGGGGVRALSSSAQITALVDSSTTSVGTREVMQAEIERMREAFGFERSHGVERALVGHVLLCWVRMQIAEAALTSGASGRHNMREGAYLDGRLSAAQGRFLRAVALLERLRRYAPPLVQVNIAQTQQINSGGQQSPSGT